MVTSYGMSPKLGSVTIGEAGGEVFLGAALQDLGSVGPAHPRPDRRGDRADRRGGQGAGRARAAANWASVQETARALLEHETLSGVALDAVLSTVDEIEIAEIPLPERG